MISEDYFYKSLSSSEDVKEDRLGITVTSGQVSLKKNSLNRIGVSIGGGFPNCPCLYIVQVFDKSPAAEYGNLIGVGDEIVGINGKKVKGKTKEEVALMIETSKDEVMLLYNRLHMDMKQEKSLDIALKTLKHRAIENIKTSTTNAFNLSRAVLVNDEVSKKMNKLDDMISLINGLLNHTKRLLHAFYEESQVHKVFGELLAAIGVRETQVHSSEAFTSFGNAHRAMEQTAMETLKSVTPMMSDLNTYLSKAVPDTQRTIHKYLDSKFEYLSYSLKVHEMEEEEEMYAVLGIPLQRVTRGNYQFRLILRCQQETRKHYLKLRHDALVKIELLENKHVHDAIYQLRRFVVSLSKYYSNCFEAMCKSDRFPVYVELPLSTFTYQMNLHDHIDAEDENI